MLYYSTAAWLFFLMSVGAQRFIRLVWDFLKEFKRQQPRAAWLDNISGLVKKLQCLREEEA